MRNLICGLAVLLCITPAAAGTLVPHTVQAADGLIRHYMLYVPRSVRSPAPVVVYHHGGGMGALKAATGAANTGRAWGVLAEQEGFLVAYPNGTSNSNGRTDTDAAMFNDCDKPRGGNDVASDDVAAARAIVAHLGGMYLIDRSRIYATGVSNGGMMAMRLGREAGDLFAAVAGVAALNPKPVDDECLNGSRVAPLMIVQGTADLFMPFRGGCGIGGACRLGFDETVSTWRNWLGLAVEPLAKSLLAFADSNRGDLSTISCQSFANGAFVPCTVHGGGHNEPSILIRLGLLGLPFGNQNGDVEAAQLQWAFFKDKQLGWPR